MFSASLLSQVPAATDTQIVTVLLGVAAITAIVGSILGTLLAGKKLFYPQVSRQEQYVTKQELTDAINSLDRKMDSLKIDLGTRVDRLETDLTDKMEKLDDYLHSSNHQNANTLQRVLLKLQTVLVAMNLPKPQRLDVELNDEPESRTS